MAIQTIDDDIFSDWFALRDRPIKLDKIRNLHGLDTIATENCGTHSR